MIDFLGILNVTQEPNGDYTIEFTSGAPITLSQQQWVSEIDIAFTNYSTSLMRALIVNEYFTNNTITTATFNSTAPNNAWITKSG